MLYRIIAIPLKISLPKTATIVDAKREFKNGECFAQCICWGLNIPFDPSIQKNHKNRIPDAGVYLHPADALKLRISETLLDEGQPITQAGVQKTLEHTDFVSNPHSFLVLIIDETRGKTSRFHSISIKRNDATPSLFDPRLHREGRPFFVQFETPSNAIGFIATEWRTFTENSIRDRDRDGQTRRKRPRGETSAPPLRFQSVLYTRRC
jgi:hypothetical protein